MDGLKRNNFIKRSLSLALAFILTFSSLMCSVTFDAKAAIMWMSESDFNSGKIDWNDCSELSGNLMSGKYYIGFNDYAVISEMSQAVTYLINCVKSILVIVISPLI